MPNNTDLHRRCMRTALQGLFAGDTLSRPAHSLTASQHLQDMFSGGISGHVARPHPHQRRASWQAWPTVSM